MYESFRLHFTICNLILCKPNIFPFNILAVGLMPSTGPLEDCLTNTTFPCPINSQNWTYMQFLFDPQTSSQSGIFSLGLIPGYAFNSGVILMIVLTVMVIGSMPFVRRGGCFEVCSWFQFDEVIFFRVLEISNTYSFRLLLGVLLDSFAICCLLDFANCPCSKFLEVVFNSWNRIHY